MVVRIGENTMVELKGVNYKDVSIKFIIKAELNLSNEIEEKISKDALVEKCKNSLQEKGKVYFVTKKRLICGVVFLKRKIYEAGDFSSKEADNTFDPKQETPTMELDELFLTQELQTKEKLIMSDIIDLLKDYIIFHDNKIKAIIWNENVLVNKSLGKDRKKYDIVCIIIGAFIGCIFGIALLEDILLGLGLGALFGMFYSSLFFVVAQGQSFKGINQKETE